MLYLSRLSLRMLSNLLSGIGWKVTSHRVLVPTATTLYTRFLHLVECHAYVVSCLVFGFVRRIGTYMGLH